MNTDRPFERKAPPWLTGAILIACAASGCSSSNSNGGAGGASAGTGGSGGGAANGTGGRGAGGASGTGGVAGGSGSGGGPGAGGMNSAGVGGAGGSAAVPIFSDGFEAATLNSKWTPRINGGGTFTLDASKKHGGNQSLHVAPSNGFSTLLAIEGAPLFPAPSNTFFGRVWLLVPTLPPTAHVIWLEAGDVTNDTHEVRIGMNSGFLQTNLYFNGEVDLRDPAATMTANTWMCVEFKMGPDELVVWLNGTQSTGVSTTNWARVGNGANGGGNPVTGWSPTYAAFRLGWELNASSDIWYDDVALGYSKIGCQ